MKKTSFKISDIRDRIIPFLAFVSVYLFDLLYIIRRGRRLLDSDMASELVLSDVLNREHSILGLSSSWYYSTEIKALGLQMFYRLGLVLFPHNWLAARTFGMAIALMLFAAAVILLLRTKDGNCKWGFFAAALCLAPGGSWYFWQTIFGGFYLVYILISLYTLVFIRYFVQAKGRAVSRILYIAGIVILGVGSGENGIKQLMVFYAPLVLALIILVLWDVHRLADVSEDLRKDKLREMTSPKYLLLALTGAVSSFAGYLINICILVRKYSFKDYNETLIIPGNMWERLREYIWSFGFNQNIKLMSFAGIAAMIGVLIGVTTLVTGVWLVCRLGKLESFDRVLALTCAVSIAFGVFVFSYTPSSGIQYYQSFVPEGLFLMVLFVKSFEYTFEKLRNVMVYVFIGCMLLASAGTVLSETDKPLHYYRAEEYMASYVDYVRLLGYEQGVSTFWKSNLITELSNGEIEMWTILSSGDPVIQEWLQKKSHNDALPQGKYFYHISVTEYPSDAFAAEHPELEMIYSDDKYVIFGN